MFFCTLGLFIFLSSPPLVLCSPSYNKPNAEVVIQTTYCRIKRLQSESAKETPTKRTRPARLSSNHAVPSPQHRRRCRVPRGARGGDPVPVPANRRRHLRESSTRLLIPLPVSADGQRTDTFRPRLLCRAASACAATFSAVRWTWGARARGWARCATTRISA